MSGGALEASVTLEEVFAALASKRVPLAPELAGYLALEITERADPEGGDIDPKSVFMSEEGTVALVTPRRESPLGDAESSIRAALTRLIEATGSQTPALAAACKRKSGGGLPALAQELEAALIPVNRAAGRRALARLAREVKRVTLGVGRHTLPSSPDSLRAGGPAQAPAPSDAGTPSSRRGRAAPSGPLPEGHPRPAPSPGNRPRVARFSPEEDPTTTRKPLPEELRSSAPPLEQGELPTTQFKAGRDPSPSQADVDDLIADFAVSGGGEQQHSRELRALAGLEPTPAPPSRLSPSLPRRRAVQAASKPAAELDALLELGQEAQKDASGRLSRPGAPVTAERGAGAADRIRFDPRQIPTQPSKLRQSRAAPPRPPVARSRYGAAVLALLALCGGAYAVRELQPGLFASRARAGDQRAIPAPGTDAPMASPSPLPSSPTQAACNGTLLVSDVPPRAEVLLRVGQAPLDVERMPVGARLEFVATAEGYAAKRIVVPSGASWETGPDGKPRFEADAQLEPFAARPGTLGPWPPAEPGSAVGGQGPAGTVHVMTTPRGAEVWMVAGVGPEARIEQLSCERDIDVLVAGPATRHRLRVTKSDFAFDAPDNAAGAGILPGQTRVARVSSK